MSSEARIEANRQNAQHSTGPATEEGKARSSRNAMKHGFFARDLLLPGESEKEFHELVEGLLMRMAPRDVYEVNIVDQIIADMWKLRRVRSAEHQLMLKRDRAMRDSTGTSSSEPGRLLLAALCDSENPELDRLHRYERRLLKSLQHNMRELRRCREDDSWTSEDPCDAIRSLIEQHTRPNLHTQFNPPPADAAPQPVDNSPAIGSDASSDAAKPATTQPPTTHTTDAERPPGAGGSDAGVGDPQIVQNEPNAELVAGPAVDPHSKSDRQFHRLRR
jgi:hypothetical protein